MSSAFAPYKPSLALEAHDVCGALQLLPTVVGELAAQFGAECLVHDMSFRGRCGVGWLGWMGDGAGRVSEGTPSGVHGDHPTRFTDPNRAGRCEVSCDGLR